MRHPVRELNQADATLDGLAPKIAQAGLIAGIAGLAASAALGLLGGAGMERLLRSYLVAFTYLLSISLGGLFFVMLQHLVRAGWSVVVRRLAEALAMNLPLLALFFVPILLGLRQLYPWADPATVAEHAIAVKRAYLNPLFFVLRWVLFLGLWSYLARYFWSRSVRQDVSGDVGLTLAMERRSGPFMVFYALTVNFAAMDLLMSLDPTWYSTIFGVYFFSGGVLGFFALLSVLTALLQRSGRLGGAVTDEHYHDLGKLVFAFVIFWAYIAFSQFMLMWYANIPEETRWYLVRTRGGWLPVSYLLLFGHFVVPFFYLLPRFVKRRPKLFGPIAAWVLLMHYADIYWLIMPQASPGQVPAHLLDLTCAVGLGGLWIAAAAHRLRKHALVPLRDPRLAESLAFENA